MLRRMAIRLLRTAIGAARNHSALVIALLAIASAACSSRTEDVSFQRLGDLAGGGVNGHALAVSHDGRVIVGVSNSANETEAFRWSNGEMVGLGDLAGGTFRSMARGVSANGDVVVGRATSAHGDEAFVWSEAEGLRSLVDVLRESLPSELADWQLSDALAVSADRRTVVGFGINPAGERECWIATLSTLPPAAER